MRILRSFVHLVVLVGMLALSSFAAADNVNRIALDLTHGARGCPPSYRITVEFLGGPSGTAVLGTGVMDPPEPNGYKANDFNRVRINVTPQINSRMIKNVRLRVSGDGPGVPIRDGWDLRRIKITNEANQRVMWGQDTPFSFTWDALTWTSPDWPTYDLEGTDTLSGDWKLVLVTGGDDLRDDSTAGAVLYFRDGTTCRVDIGRGVGLDSRNSSAIPVTLGTRDQKLSDLMKVVLFKSCYREYGQFDYKSRNYSNRPSNADDWEVDEIGVRVNLADRDNVEREFRALRGKITEGTKAQTMSNAYEPIPFARSLASVKARLTVFIWGPYKGNDRPEIHALIRRRGETVFERVIYRKTVDQGYYSWIGATTNTMWKVGITSFEDVRSSPVSEGSQHLTGLFSPWTSDSQQPIQEVQIGLYQKGTGGGTVYEPYKGNSSVMVRGIWLGLEANNGTLMPDRIQSAQPLFANHLTLAMTLGMEDRVLNKTNRTINYPIVHTSPLRSR